MMTMILGRHHQPFALVSLMLLIMHICDFFVLASTNVSKQPIGAA